MLPFNKLPDEIIKMVFLYLQSPEAKMISDEVNIYEQDHNYYITKQSGYYLVKSVMSFSDYYFDRLREPYEYDSLYKHPKNIHKLNYHITYINSYFKY